MEKEEEIVTRRDIENFKVDVNNFNNLTGQIPYTMNSKSFELGDYLKWCEVKRLDKLIKLIEAKA